MAWKQCLGVWSTVKCTIAMELQKNFCSQVAKSYAILHP